MPPPSRKPKTLAELSSTLRPVVAHWQPTRSDDYGPDDYGQMTRVKGDGYFGPIPMSDGGVMTEYSIRVPIAGKDREIPTLVPTLTSDEIQQVMMAAMDGSRLPEAVIRKAVDYAEARVAKGLNPFAQPEDTSRYRFQR